jgi:CRP-like cAMP-binding protein
MTDLTKHIKELILRQGIALSDEAWDDFHAIWEVVNVKRKSVITMQGETEKYLYFVTEGVQRVYYFDEKNREATLVFSYPYSFAGVLDSFLLQSPSKYYFETLTSSVLLRTSYSQFQSVLKKHSELDHFAKTLINYVVSGLLERIVELQCFSSEDKFKILLKRSPHILQHVPHKYLANYLGIDPTNFSKLLNSVKA